MAERLQKLLAAAGLCSRRMAEEWISAGRVCVNGAPATLGDRADPETDTITVDGQALPADTRRVYLMLNKPRGYVTTLSDEYGRHTAAELVSGCGARVYPVGRLDRDSEGLRPPAAAPQPSGGQGLSGDGTRRHTGRGGAPDGHHGAGRRAYRTGPGSGAQPPRGAGPPACHHPSGQEPADTAHVRRAGPACGKIAARGGGRPAAGRPPNWQVEILDSAGNTKDNGRRYT